MPVAKQVADFFTLLRALLAPALMLLGYVRGSEGLAMASWMLIGSWMSDSLDGPLARRSRIKYRTWLGDHDLEVDMWASFGLMIYMLLAGYLGWQLVAVYILLWSFIFWHWGLQRSLGMLFQAPIYGWFIYLALRFAPQAGFWMVGWIIAVVVITWPRFPQEVVPGFLQGMQAVVHIIRKEE
jgi:cardiolipin synthase